MKYCLKVFFLPVICLFLTISPILAQDFSFGGRGNANNGFRNALIPQLPGITNLGVTGATRTISPKGILPNGYLNTTTNVAANLLPNGNDKSFNVVDTVIADVNGDGINDVVTIADDSKSQINAPSIPSGIFSTGRITLFSGTGDGTFGFPISVTTASSPTCMAAADFDLDGKIDILVGEQAHFEIFSGSNLVSGLTALAFPTGGIDIPSNKRVASVSVGRINDDGFPDIVIALNNFTPGQGDVLIYTTSSTGMLNPPVIINTRGEIGFINNQQVPAIRAVATFQSNVTLPVPNTFPDNDIDIGVATSLGLEIFENTSQPTKSVSFESSVILAAGSSSIGFIPGDINGDNITDISILDHLSGTITTYIATTNNYQMPQTYKVGKPIMSATLVNFGNGRKTDLLVATKENVVVLKNSGAGIFTNSEEFSFEGNLFPLFNPSSVATGILDTTNKNNNADDIVIADGFSNTKDNKGSTGGVLFLSSRLGNNPLGLKLFTNMSLASDFDGIGGLNDVALIEQTTGTVFILLNLTVSTLDFSISSTVVTIALKDIFARTDLIPTSATSFVDAQTGLNNIAITYVPKIPTENSTGILLVGINDGSGMFIDNAKTFRQFVATTGATSIRSADFRNTGQASDLVYTDYLNNLVAVNLNDGNNFFTTPKFTQTIGLTPVSIAFADINDDDFLDLLVLNNGSVPNKLGVRQSLVSVFLGQGDGKLMPTGDLLNVPNFGLSIVGGLAILDNTLISRMVDFNEDGFPDFAVNSTGGGNAVLGQTVVPTVSLLLNHPDLPGKFKVQAPVSLFDDTAITGINNTSSGAVLALDDSLGSAALVSGKGGINTKGLTETFGGIGVGGANYTMAVCDFNSDNSPDLVVSGSISVMQNLDSSQSKLTPTNYRGTVYLVGNNTAGTVRISRPMRTREYTLFADGVSNPALNAGDTFIASTIGSFAKFNNFVLDTLHLSINGGLFMDANTTSVLVHAPITQTNRNNFNAPFPGGGRKVLLTSGEIYSLLVTSIVIDSDQKVNFSLTPTNTGVQPPAFVRVKDNGNNTATVMIDTRNNGTGVNNGSDTLQFPIVVQASTSSRGVGGRSLLIGREYFTVIVKPKAAPTIAPIPNQTVEINTTKTIDLMVADKAGTPIKITKTCDKDNYISINGTTLLITPTANDVGANLCTITATGSTGLFASTSFAINVTSNKSPIINEVKFNAENKQLLVNGSKFGMSGAKVNINNQDVSNSISNQTDNTIILKGNKKKLTLKKKLNQIIVTTTDGISKTFEFNL